MSDLGFEQFWTLYPRKVARKDAERAWKKLDAAQQFAALQALPHHARYWQSAGRTAERIPHAASWLNGERWADELEMPEAEEVKQWWKTPAGIEAKAREIGIAPKPGEGYADLKARIMAAAH